MQTGRIREALLMLYSDMAHQYTRGTWLAPETRRLQEGAEAAPYCTPAQLVVALMTRWLIVLEDPDAKALSLGKGIPRDWLADGKTVSVRNAPTRWGPVGYRIDSHVDSGSVHVRLTLPEHGLPVETRLSLRVPGDTPIARVVDRAGRDVALAIADGVITIPDNSGGEREFVVRYAPKRSGAEPKRTTQRTTH